MYIGLRHVFMAGEPGGGGGAGGGAVPPGDMPEAWMEAIITKVSGLLQKSLTSRDAQADKKREQDQAAIKKMLDEALGARGAGGGSNEPPPEGKEGAGKNKKDDVAYQTLQKRLDEIQQRSDAFERRAGEERKARRQVNLVQSLMSSLGALNITGERAEAARDSLLYREQVGYADDESDEIVFRGVDGMSTELPLGLRQWSKSQPAQIFLPPSGVNGSGSRPGGGGRPASDGKPNKEQQLATLADLFDRNMP